MIWSIKISDIITLPNDLYKYEVKDVYRDWAVLENCLTHLNREIRVSTLLKEATIERRVD